MSAIGIVSILVGILTVGGYQQISQPDTFSIGLEGELEEGSSTLDPQPLSVLYIVDASAGCEQGERLWATNSNLDDGENISIDYTAEKKEIQDQQEGVDLDPTLIQFCATTTTGDENYESVNSYTWQELKEAASEEETVYLKTKSGLEGLIKWKLYISDFTKERQEIELGQILQLA
ncbi:hypothetical protein [Natrinema sp. H-ect4]|uniref:hypothetical protein n=1 Tax=Natrinema sp. H-ect4 TaxID=3242699 RepID=UPI0035A9404E